LPRFRVIPAGRSFAIEIEERDIREDAVLLKDALSRGRRHLGTENDRRVKGDAAWERQQSLEIGFDEFRAVFAAAGRDQHTR
jgi:hypothetical protein